MIAKIYADEDVSPLLAELLRKEGVDAISAHDIGMNGKNDEAQLSYATQEQRVLVTFNAEDFSKLAIRKNHAGIILCPQVARCAYIALVEGIIDKLTLIDEWEDIVIWVTAR